MLWSTSGSPSQRLRVASASYWAHLLDLLDPPTGARAMALPKTAVAPSRGPAQPALVRATWHRRAPSERRARKCEGRVEGLVQGLAQRLAEGTGRVRGEEIGPRTFPRICTGIFFARD